MTGIAPLPVSGLYAAALTLLFVVLSARVILYRRGHGISLGDAGDPVLVQRMRAQGNWAEYAPLGLVLLIIAELQGHPTPLLHAVGALLLIGRLMHGINFSFGIRSVVLRTGGMALTLTALILGAVLVLPV
jgi:uncharacterized protein